jgi:transcriptional regulator with XRE-family HTH domain
MPLESQQQNFFKYHELQRAAGLSNSQAADYLGMNISTIKRYRNGKLKPPKLVLMALTQLAESKKK